MGYKAEVKTKQYMEISNVKVHRYLEPFFWSIVFLSVFIGTYLIWHANFIYSQTDDYKSKQINKPYLMAANKYCYDVEMAVATWTKIDANHLRVLCGVSTADSIFPIGTTSFIIKRDEKIQVYIK